MSHELPSSKRRMSEYFSYSVFETTDHTVPDMCDWLSWLNLYGFGVNINHFTVDILKDFTVYFIYLFHFLLCCKLTRLCKSLQENHDPFSSGTARAATSEVPSCKQIHFGSIQCFYSPKLIVCIREVYFTCWMHLLPHFLAGWISLNVTNGLLVAQCGSLCGYMRGYMKIICNICNRIVWSDSLFLHKNNSGSVGYWERRYMHWTWRTAWLWLWRDQVHVEAAEESDAEQVRLWSSKPLPQMQTFCWKYFSTLTSVTLWTYLLETQYF